MEYYPIYIFIKNQVQKRLLFVSFVISFALTAGILHHYNDKGIPGITFDQMMSQSGVKEVYFKFDKDVVRFSSYEQSVNDWNRLMELEFDLLLAR